MCEPLYGFPSNMPAQEFVKVKGTTDLFYTYDEELDVNKLLSEPLPPPSIAINVVPHWLAIDGVQPLIPENPSLDSHIYYQQQTKEREETLTKAKAKKPTVTGPPPHPSTTEGEKGEEEKKEGKGHSSGQGHSRQDRLKRGRQARIRRSRQARVTRSRQQAKYSNKRQEEDRR